MKSIKIDISNNIAKVIEKPKRIVAGTIGLPVEFTFDSVWDDLIKTAVFTTGGKVYQIDEIDSTTTVPWEVLSVPGPQLMIGVYGEDKEGTLAIPTIWAYVDSIRPGANLVDSTANPSPAPIWVRLKKEVEAGCIAEININDEGELEVTFLNGETVNLGNIIGDPGYTPVKGKDYYTEAEKKAMVNDVLNALPKWEGGEY